MVATWKKLAYVDEVATLSDQLAHDIGTTASAGVATDASRHDHVHILGDGAVSTAAKLATDVVETLKIKDGNVTAAKLATDSVETLKIKDLNVTTGKLAADAVDGTKIADDAVGSEHIEPLSAKLECNGQQLENAVLENSATDPVVAVLGKVYFKTGDAHPYVCTGIA
jgi:hypothetical protein